MKLEQSFCVQAPADRVWEALIDVQRVAPCLPGAEITDASDDGKYRGNFTAKLGPTTAAYRGELEMESVDEASRTVTMRASGQDKRGQGGAKATIVSVLSEDGGATRVDVDTDFTITGRLARFGRGGMIKDISNRLLKDFSACLTETIESMPTAQELVTPDDPPGPSGAPVRGDTVPLAACAPKAAGSPRPAVTPSKPVNGLQLFISVLVERIKRLFDRR
ncbi:MAG: SRPBCC family protein [Thermoleophilaceae bacterium]